MNAILTWWGVSMAVLSHPIQSSSILDTATITRIIPIFVALMVWVIRIMAIGTVATAGSDIFRNPARSAQQGLPVRRRVNLNEGIPGHSPRPNPQPLAARMGSALQTHGTGRREVLDPTREPTYRRMS